MNKVLVTNSDKSSSITTLPDNVPLLQAQEDFLADLADELSKRSRKINVAYLSTIVFFQEE